MWAINDSTAHDPAAEHIPKVPYQNIEAEFQEWDNIVAYLGQNTGKTYRDVQSILMRLPLPRAYIDSYLRRIGHRLTSETRLLGRTHTQSFEFALNLVQAVIDMHHMPLKAII